MLLRRRPGSGVALLMAVASCLVGCQRQQPSTTQVGPPSVSDGFVLRPSFATSLGNISAGTAFTIKLPGHARPVVLTAIHLLGPAGGLPRDVPPTEVPEVVKRLTLKDCFDALIHIGRPGAAIPIPDAGPIGQTVKAGDILAFWGPEDSSVNPGQLAAATPAKGERVWLAASLREGAPPSQRLHPATAIGTDETGNLVYRFDNPRLSIRATSGAPVLNAAGEVVAINLGGGLEGKDMIGIGNPVGRFGPPLEAAVKRSALQPRGNLAGNEGG